MEDLTIQSPPKPPSQGSSRWGLIFWPFIVSIALLLITLMASAASCWVIGLFAVVLSYPIWLSLYEVALFSRRAMLAGATLESSSIRHLFWGGRFTSVILVFVSLSFSILFLAIGANLRAEHWAVLIIDAFVLAKLYRWFQARVKDQVKPEMLGVFVRGWPLYLTNLGFLAISFFIATFLIFGAPDLRYNSLEAVAKQAFEQGTAGIACTGFSWLAGGLNVVDQVSWAIAQRFIPALPSWDIRLLAWLIFLLKAGFLGLFYTQIQLGVITLVESRSVRAESVTGSGKISKAFILTILVLASFFLYATLKMRDIDLEDLEPAIEGKGQAQLQKPLLAPCVKQQAKAASRIEKMERGLSETQQKLIRESERRIDHELDLLFMAAESRVDSYLDWYFTVTGEYQRLASAVTGDFPSLMKEQLNELIFKPVNFEYRLNKIEKTLSEENLNQLASVSQAVYDELKKELKSNPCASSMFDPQYLGHLERDQWRTMIAASAGVIGGALGSKMGSSAAAVLAGEKAVAAITSKIAAKKGFQAAATVALKAAAKNTGGALAAALGGAAAGTAVCSPGGPLAAVCGVVAGVATWLAVDKIAVEIDEAVSRDEMRNDIISVLREERIALQEQLVERQRALIIALGDSIRETTDKAFIPARDGL